MTCSHYLQSLKALGSGVRDNITSLLSRLIGAGATSLASRLGAAAPEDRLNAALARADLVVAEAQAALGRTIAAEHDLRKRLDAARAETGAAKSAAEAHIRAGNEAEARRILARAIDLEADIPLTEAALADLGIERRTLESAVLRLAEGRRSMAEDVAAVRDAALAAHGAERFSAVETEFINALAAAARSTEAAQTARQTAANIAQLRADERARRIETRLDAARAEALQ